MALQAELNDIDKGQHGAEWICGSYQCRNFEGWFQQREMGEGNWQFVIIGFGINDCSVYRVNQSGRFTNRSCRLTSRTASPSGGANMAATTGITDRRTKPDTSRQQWKRMFGRQRRKWRAELRDRGAVSLEPIYVRAGQRRRGIVAVSDGDRLELQLLHMADGGSRCRTVAALNAAAKLRQMRAPVSAIREALSSSGPCAATWIFRSCRDEMPRRSFARSMPQG
ncbi:hypothetical protein C5F48_22190 [Cereibacter changlensis JA139]|uniref:Uncharacterized protein n=1 Tax=Cereibacter changlensis JA139 TaxID=1188249 RepID=A0A2T4JNT5_9RHOB|nr:hypothetical protein [Cereibacter changlensis]PTE19572.1 hypothetical protein C5F48_22190 [Cereibacter changlensis JA139]